MSYSVNSKSIPTITVEYGTINTETSLSLVGKDYFGYGDAIAQNFVDLLENFAKAEPVLAKRVEGQMWFDSANNQLKVWNGAAWNGTGFNQKLVADTTGAMHDIFVVTSAGTAIASFSKDAFVLNPAEDLYIASAFTSNTINTGITLAPGMKLHGTATTAEYADLAELYTSDAEYAPGTVVKIGGAAEVTQTTVEYCPEVFGVVSTNPAYLMNSMCKGTTVAVALDGRVPCTVIGEVRKGQRLVASDTPGTARALSDYEKEVGVDWFRVVGRALENKDTLGIGLVEIVVGVK